MCVKVMLALTLGRLRRVESHETPRELIIILCFQRIMLVFAPGLESKTPSNNHIFSVRYPRIPRCRVPTLAKRRRCQGIASGLCSYLRLSCENGWNYPICPIAVSNEGELVTGQLVLGRGRGIHIRLVPMGDGYRYIGRGIWFDGLFSQAALTLNKNTTVACTVEFDD